MSTYWQTYEEVATHLLNRFSEHFGLQEVQSKQRVTGNRTGTSWEIDAKGVCSDGEGFVIVECRRRTTSRQSQEDLGALAFRIIDTGADGGIIVTPLGLQAGAEKVARSENVIAVELDASSTPTDFALRFFGQLMIGASITERFVLSDHLEAEVIRTCTWCGERFVVDNNERICQSCSSENST